jgi:two-component system, cell cycle response regulator
MNILLIEDNEDDVLKIWAMLKEADIEPLNILHRDRLKTGFELLAKGNIDVILLDLHLPDSQGFDTFLAAKRQAPDIPIVVLTSLGNKIMGLEAIQQGAQDFLEKAKINSDMLARSLRYAIERQKMLSEIHQLSLVDELTGLYNRRGFDALAQKQIKLAQRLGKGMMLFFVDLDNMKWINDNFGHQEGDEALKIATAILRDSFRDSDIIARIGGDEFAVLLLQKAEITVEILTTRFQDNLDAYNAMKDRKFRLSISAGLAQYDPRSFSTIEELLEEADKNMYEQKRKKSSEDMRNHDDYPI